ncbi:maleylpyruvate isomerase family mycothiol-dependent enzyme [Streptomyces sp. 3MP-14]|uniref:Maleylpyruvate isomerase family mycothiol-dependent enzyme n=1 Tax=Streptomyces mimosae TaxID=2586635 RepID=A0A5N6A3I8_9ACTN|nr:MULTISPECIES: maleylpyruvate isomerase family mycothiol-dependent enzyme [Streptomyces]KAB8161948.1 maleylpyruvate isomerase family mycothiol-dependent enzyme [Streptomyces mimosae]KAB8173646.1 maleylpyruvate isomerase family mycothiol-dependent enzyme [Streptomyces sp. 3MP-14]
METGAHIAALDLAGRAYLSAAEATDWRAEVPSCPGWRLDDLTRHLGNVHRWAERFVRERLTERVPPPEERPSEGELADWFAEGLAALLATLRAADETTGCFTFLPGSPNGRAFWARRQAHETTVHLMDAQLAAGRTPSPTPAALALDGIDEFLTGFHARTRSRVRSAAPRVFSVRADEGPEWTVHLTEDPPRTRRGPAERFDCRVSGPAADLYAALWGRLPWEAPPLRATGDASVLTLWRERSAV